MALENQNNIRLAEYTDLKTSKVGFRIALVIGIVEIVAMIVLFVILNHNLGMILEERAVQNLNVIARDRAQMIETYISGCCDYLYGYSTATEVREVVQHPDDPECIEAAVDHTLLYARGADDIEGLYAADFDTYVLAHTNPDSMDQTFRDAASAKELEDMIRTKAGPFCTGIVLAPVTKKMVIPVYAPVYDDAGKMCGFAGGAFYTNALADRLNAISDESGIGSNYSLINASTGVYIFDSDTSLVGTECQDSEVLETISALKAGSSSENSLHFVNKDTVACCYYMANRDWVFIVKDPAESIFGIVTDIKVMIIAICTVITVVMVAIGYYSVVFQMRPLRIINDDIDKLIKNDFTINDELRHCCSLKDEFGAISRNIEELHCALENKDSLIKEILEAQTVGTIVLSADEEDVLLVNHVALEMFGVEDPDRDYISIGEIRSHFEPEENDLIREQLDKIRNTDKEIEYEAKVCRDNGDIVYLLSTARGVILSDDNRVIIVSLIDITDRKKQEYNLRIQSETDPLTLICTRSSGEYRINELSISQKHGMFCLFDINDFRYINDSFGRETADNVIMEIVNAMRKSFRTTDVLMRLGDDEFAVFAVDVEDQTIGTTLIERFVDGIRRIRVSGSGDHRITINMGIVLIKNRESFSDMYAKAYSLIEEGMKKGRNTYAFYPEL